MATLAAGRLATRTRRTGSSRSVERIQDMRGDQSTEADDPEFGVPADSLGPERVLELRARFFTDDDPSDTGYAIEDDDYLQLQLSRYFWFERKGLVMPRGGIK